MADQREVCLWLCSEYSRRGLSLGFLFNISSFYKLIKTSRMTQETHLFTLQRRTAPPGKTQIRLIYLRELKRDAASDRKRVNILKIRSSDACRSLSLPT